MESLVPCGIKSNHVVFEPLGNGSLFTRRKMLKVMRVELLLLVLCFQRIVMITCHHHLTMFTVILSSQARWRGVENNAGATR